MHPAAQEHFGVFVLLRVKTSVTLSISMCVFTYVPMYVRTYEGACMYKDSSVSL